jgi:hypothetical protein
MIRWCRWVCGHGQGLRHDNVERALRLVQSTTAKLTEVDVFCHEDQQKKEEVVNCPPPHLMVVKMRAIMLSHCLAAYNLTESMDSKLGLATCMRVPIRQVGIAAGSRSPSSARD